jgi:hypothetical protein
LVSGTRYRYADQELSFVFCVVASWTLFKRVFKTIIRIKNSV